MNRRVQKPITIRSDQAAARLALLTRDGRSQARVIEEALEQMPVPTEKAVNEAEARIARLNAIIDRFAACPGPSMAAFDAAEYDVNGNPR